MTFKALPIKIQQSENRQGGGGWQGGGADRVNRKGKIRPLKLLGRSEDTKKVFYVLKEPFPSEGQVQTTFKAIEKFTCAMHGRKNFLQLTKHGWTFS